MPNTVQYKNINSNNLQFKINLKTASKGEKNRTTCFFNHLCLYNNKYLRKGLSMKVRGVKMRIDKL